jgi:MFS family permease
VIAGLGTARILDGIEVTIIGAVAPRMTEAGSGISITTAGIGTAASSYIAGACLGALVFGHLTDRFGRKRLFMLTLALCLIATAGTAFAFSPWYFYLFRFLTGAGIEGEYRCADRPGCASGSPNGPGEPRWLFIHSREEEAERIVAAIESGVEDQTSHALEPVQKSITVHQRRVIGFGEIARTAFRRYPGRSVLAQALFVGQAFMYTSVTRNLGTLMSTFFKVSSGIVPVFTIVYAAGNLCGPLVLGRQFDTVGRKPMITTTYVGSAVVTVLLAMLLSQTDLLGSWTFIIIVMGTFFLASAGASAAYLTASEIFPMETRALAIAFFYVIGTAVGGIIGPLLFAHLISSGERSPVAIGFLIGAAVMAFGGLTELFLGVKAERVQLEDVATPLTASDKGTAEPVTRDLHAPAARAGPPVRRIS